LTVLSNTFFWHLGHFINLKPINLFRSIF
jgi:hypothetical protein